MEKEEATRIVESLTGTEKALLYALIMEITGRGHGKQTAGAGGSGDEKSDHRKYA